MATSQISGQTWYPNWVAPESSGSWIVLRCREDDRCDQTLNRPQPSSTATCSSAKLYAACFNEVLPLWWSEKRQWKPTSPLWTFCCGTTPLLFNITNGVPGTCSWHSMCFLPEFRLWHLPQNASNSMDPSASSPSLDPSTWSATIEPIQK